MPRDRLSLRVLAEDLRRASALLEEPGAAIAPDAAAGVLQQLARLGRLMRDAALVGRVLDVVEGTPGLTGSGVALAARANKPEVLAILRRLEAAGVLAADARGQARVWGPTGLGGPNRFAPSKPVRRVAKLVARRA